MYPATIWRIRKRNHDVYYAADEFEAFIVLVANPRIWTARELLAGAKKGAVRI
jgi:hypothetical protein